MNARKKVPFFFCIIDFFYHCAFVCSTSLRPVCLQFAFVVSICNVNLIVSSFFLCTHKIHRETQTLRICTLLYKMQQIKLLTLASWVCARAREKGWKQNISQNENRIKRRASDRRKLSITIVIRHGSMCNVSHCLPKRITNH